MKRTIQTTWSDWFPQYLLTFLKVMDRQGKRLEQGRKAISCSPEEYERKRNAVYEEKATVRLEALRALRDEAARLVKDLDAEIGKHEALEAREAANESRDTGAIVQLGIGR